ncbi:CpsD/CapB family tyrosine-protein kinase [Senegalia massiliensis]|uniref:CpsD/CapB family tyrosine-protein kinase n=1 Tax=Senegalia massiliensis TaxID=1720316 RepID=UPI00102FFEF3|nr:CpsD/CapB family tyrosine-protein kinase [Senegalia massiliensis]
MSRYKIVTHYDPKSPIAEAYRTLRTNIQFSNFDKKLKSIVVTSAGPGEGKSTTAVNLAVSMAQDNKAVLLIDCDFRKPQMHKYFAASNRVGVTNIIAEGMEQDLASTHIKDFKLDVLPSGPIPPNPSELLGSNRMKEFIESMENIYDMVIIDAPPVGVVTDASIISTYVGGVILVCGSGQAHIEASKHAKELITKVGGNILGVVLNKIPMNEGRYAAYSYQSYYGDSK